MCFLRHTSCTCSPLKKQRFSYPVPKPDATDSLELEIRSNFPLDLRTPTQDFASVIVVWSCCFVIEECWSGVSETSGRWKARPGRRLSPSSGTLAHKATLLLLRYWLVLFLLAGLCLFICAYFCVLRGGSPLNITSGNLENKWVLKTA